MSRVEVPVPDGVTMVVRGCGGGCASLDLLSVRPELRGRGLARAALGALAARADALGLTVHLRVSDAFGCDRAGLRRLYGSVGFRATAGTGGAMVRRPA